jgi:hypothetical protein
MKTITINLYSFSELSKEAQQKAINKLATINVDFAWWNTTYEDAKNIGLEITSFDLDRNRNAQGKFNISACEVAQNILNEHGEDCQAYKIAAEFLDKHNPLFSDYMDESSEHYESAEQEGKLQDLESEFLNNLLNEYANILQKECDYLMSEQAIIETIEANDYTFEENGAPRNA